jgi:hypothetical protein
MRQANLEQNHKENQYIYSFAFFRKKVEFNVIVHVLLTFVLHVQ